MINDNKLIALTGYSMFSSHVQKEYKEYNHVIVTVLIIILTTCKKFDVTDNKQKNKQ